MANAPLYDWCRWHANATCTPVASNLQPPCNPDYPPETSGQDDGTSGVATDDPVSSATGELYLETRDLDLGGPRPSVWFGRYYGSLLTRDAAVGTPLGTNWMHVFDLRMEDIEGVPTVFLDRGKTVGFHFVTGMWRPIEPEPTAFQLAEEGQGWRLMDPATDLVYAFDYRGRLTSISGRNQRSLTLTHTTNLLTRVSDGVGRRLDLTYTADRLTRIQDQTGRAVSFFFDGAELGSVTDPRSLSTSYDYTTVGDLQGLLASSTRPEGTTPFTQTFDDQGRVATQTDSGGHVVQVDYDTPDDDVTRVTDPSLFVIEHRHEFFKRLLSHRDQEGRSISIAYDGDSRRVGVADRLGDETSIAFHGASGKIASVTDATGEVLSLTYGAQPQAGFTFYNLKRVDFPDGTHVLAGFDASGNVVSRTDRAGGLWTATFNPQGQITSAANPAGGTTTWTYNPDATLASVTDAFASTTSFTYDTARRLKGVGFADGTSRAYSWNAADLLLSATDERGKTTSFSWDGNGNLASVTDALGRTTSYGYDGNDRLVSVLDPLGHTWDLGYSARGRLQSVSSPLAETLGLGYDSLNRLATVTDPGGSVSARSYDPEGVLSAVTDPAGHSWSLASDARGRVTRLASPLGSEHTLEWDPMGRLVSVTDPLSRSTEIGYDQRGLLASVTLTDGASVALTRNQLGLVSSLNDANGNRWDSTFDTAGRLTEETDPLGRTVAYHHDSRGRVSGVDLPGGSLAITYTPAGEVSRLLYSDGTDLTYSWDAEGRLVSATGLGLAWDDRGLMSSCNGVTADRDAAGRVSSLTLAPGKTVTYRYDQRGRVREILDWVSGSTRLTYDAAGRVHTLTRPNGVVTTWWWDADGRLVGLSDDRDSTLASIDLVRNAAGDVVTAVRNLPLQPLIGSGTVAFEVDDAHQIDGATYDDLGRLTSDGQRTFVWDLATRLRSAADTESLALTSDGLGFTTSISSGGQSRGFVWNHLLGWPVVSIVREGEDDLRYYIHTPDGRLLHSIEAASSARRYFHFDELGNTTFLTGGGGGITDAWGITPYGRITARQGTTENPFTFGGAWGVLHLGQTNLYGMGARVYDAATARFLSRRPERSAHPRRVSPYTFAALNPLRFVEPLGGRPFDPAAPPWPSDPLGRCFGLQDPHRDREAREKFLNGRDRHLARMARDLARVVPFGGAPCADGPSCGRPRSHPLEGIRRGLVCADCQSKVATVCELAAREGHLRDDAACPGAAGWTAGLDLAPAPPVPDLCSASVLWFPGDASPYLPSVLVNPTGSLAPRNRGAACSGGTAAHDSRLPLLTTPWTVGSLGWAAPGLVTVLGRHDR